MVKDVHLAHVYMEKQRRNSAVKYTPDEKCKIVFEIQ